MSLFCPQPFTIRRTLRMEAQTLPVQVPLLTLCSPRAFRRTPGSRILPAQPPLHVFTRRLLSPSPSPTLVTLCHPRAPHGPGPRLQDVTGAPHPGCWDRWAEEEGPVHAHSLQLGAAARPPPSLCGRGGSGGSGKRTGPRTPQSFSQPWQGSPGRTC